MPTTLTARRATAGRAPTTRGRTTPTPLSRSARTAAVQPGRARAPGGTPRASPPVPTQTIAVPGAPRRTLLTPGAQRSRPGTRRPSQQLTTTHAPRPPAGTHPRTARTTGAPQTQLFRWTRGSIADAHNAGRRNAETDHELVMVRPKRQRTHGTGVARCEPASTPVSPARRSMRIIVWMEIIVFSFFMQGPTRSPDARRARSENTTESSAIKTDHLQFLQSSICWAGRSHATRTEDICRFYQGRSSPL